MMSLISYNSLSTIRAMSPSDHNSLKADETGVSASLPAVGAVQAGPQQLSGEPQTPPTQRRALQVSVGPGFGEGTPAGGKGAGKQQEPETTG